MISCNVFRVSPLTPFGRFDCLVTRHTEITISFRVQDVYIETSLNFVGSDHRVQPALCEIRRPEEHNLAHVLWQSHSTLDA